MPTRITETERVAGTLRRVKLGETAFRVPATPTIKYMFWMRSFLAKFGEGAITDDDIVECYEQTLSFLRRYNDQVDRDAIEESCELEDLITFYNRCFGANPESEEDERPPRATRGGANSRSSRARSRS